MAMTLGINKGKEYGSSEFVGMLPVSFQRVWNEVWERAIVECQVHIFLNCHYFPISLVPNVIEELDRIYEWAQINGGKDTEYISMRIQDELKPFLVQFFQEHKDEDYWFDLG